MHNTLIWLWLPPLVGLVAVAVGLLLFSAVTARKVERAAPPTGAFVQLGSARLHFVEQGHGSPLLLIHGIAGNLRHFTYGVTDRLAKSHRVIAVDRPACGYSLRNVGAAASLQAQADTMVELLDHLKIDKAIVVGHSLGGAIALAIAQRHPQRLAALVLIAPLTRLPSQPSPAFKLFGIEHNWLRRLVAWTLATPITIARSKATLQLVFGPETAPRDFATRAGGLLALRPSHFIAASTDLRSAQDGMPAIEGGYAGMRVNAHVLYGRSDRILSPRENGSDLVGRLAGTRLTLIEGGHMLPITQPQTTADFILDVARKTVF